MDFLKDRVKTLYFHLLFAAVGSALVSSIFGIVDAMMVGQYHGPNGVAALSVFSPIWNIVYSLGILSGIGGSVLYANRRGASQMRKANEYFASSIIFGVVLATLSVAAIGIFHNQMFRFFGANDELLELANTYLKPILFAVPCCVFNNILSAYLRNDGDAKLAMKAVLFSGAFNVAGDYFFIFVMDMGILGAGLATAIAQYVVIIAMLTHFVRKKNTLRFVKPHAFISKIGEISKTGFSTALSDVSMGIITVLFNRSIMSYLGVDALSVYGIIAQIVPLVQCCAYGAGQAAQPIISQNLGAGQNERIGQSVRYGLLTCAAFGALWFALVDGFPTLFVNLFMTPTEEVLAIAPGIMRVYGFAFLFVPFNIFATYYFQSMLRPAVSLVISMARGFLLSGVLILALPAIFGADSLWVAMPITELLVFAFAMAKMRQAQRGLQVQE